jgi:outer membrane protein, heavy metal efflux system
MQVGNFRVFAAFGALMLAGCAAQRYQPAPIIPTESASRIESRSLNDAGLRAFLEKNLGETSISWPQKTWDLRTLSLAALYFNPSLDTARANVEEADAAAVTAGARPNPTFDVSPGVPSPYLFSLDLNFPIETAGKRGYRIESATKLEQAARFDLADQAWKVRSEVRGALLDYMMALRKSDLLDAEEKLRTTQTNLLEQRLSAGEIARTELESAQIALSQTQLRMVAENGQTTETKAKLAAAIGVPVGALAGIEFSWSDLQSPPDEGSFSPQEIQQDAVLNRMDVRRALAQYAAAESDLQLEIAKQYPDVQIGPGYTYEERQNYFIVGISVTLPIFDRNQGPIAEAEAKRKAAAANFRAIQSQVIAESEEALTAYANAERGLSARDQSLQRTVQQNRMRLMQQATQVGEEDQVAMNSTEIDGNALDQARLDAVDQAQIALGALEDAMQRPLDAGDAFPQMQQIIEPMKEASR